MNFNSLANLNIAGAGSLGIYDWVILGIFLISLLLHFFLLRRDRMHALFFSILSSYLWIVFVPWMKWFGDWGMQKINTLQAGGFLGLIILFYLIYTLSHVFSPLSRSFLIKTIHKIVFAFISPALIFSFLALMVPLEWLNNFSSFTLKIFVSESSGFYCLVLAFIMFLIGYRPTRKGPGRPSLR